MKRRFSSKEESRKAVWDVVQAERVARFPFSPTGRTEGSNGTPVANRW